MLEVRGSVSICVIHIFPIPFAELKPIYFASCGVYILNIPAQAPEFVVANETLVIIMIIMVVTDSSSDKADSRRAVVSYFAKEYVHKTLVNY